MLGHEPGARAAYASLKVCGVFYSLAVPAMFPAINISDEYVRTGGAKGCDGRVRCGEVVGSLQVGDLCGQLNLLGL
jgi:hypothetical protein